MTADARRIDDPASFDGRVEQLRSELRAWLASNLSSEIVEAGRHELDGAGFDVLRSWNRTLADGGWAAPAWPVVHGGRAASVAEQVAYQEEMSRAEAPGPINGIGVSNIAPAIMAFGTDEQAGRFLRPLLRGDEIWCQGMSEPDAGSDLASLRATAVPDDSHFVVNGQKTWTSHGHLADWCQLYVRTDPRAPKHKGLSCFLVDMRTSGIEARPMPTITGDLTFSELFFSDVNVPTSALLGPLHEGWRVAITTLSFERAGVARHHLTLARKLDRLIGELRVIDALGDPRIRDRVASVYSRIACMRWYTSRCLAEAAGSGEPSAAMGSLAKLAWSDTEKELASLAVDALGVRSLDGEWGTNVSFVCCTSLAGGTSEINRNIIGERVLGLPREPGGA